MDIANCMRACEEGRAALLREKTFRLRASTTRSRGEVMMAFYAGLDQVGGLICGRAGSPGCLILQIRLSTVAVAGMYTRMVATGLTFDRRSHWELATLCTLGWHMTQEQPVELLLDLTLQQEGQPRAVAPVIMGHA